jgi:hypothetical protein
MAGLQDIINNATTLQINRRKMVGIQYSRNQIAKVGETPTRNPWRFTIKHDRMIPYAQARQLIEEIDTLDRATPQQVTMSSNSKLSFLFAYQGAMTAAQINALRITSFNGNQLVLNSLSTITPLSTMFKKGDFIQIVGHPYPFTVTADVIRPAGSDTVTITTHRGNFISDSVANGTLIVGNSINFYMLCTNMPNYTLQRGGANALITFDSDFELYEYTGLEL